MPNFSIFPSILPRIPCASVFHARFRQQIPTPGQIEFVRRDNAARSRFLTNHLPEIVRYFVMSVDADRLRDFIMLRCVFRLNKNRDLFTSKTCCKRLISAFKSGSSAVVAESVLPKSSNS
jgi:hypothetical protein